MPLGQRGLVERGGQAEQRTLRTSAANAAMIPMSLS
jgi:hypothetical protein